MRRASKLLCLALLAACSSKGAPEGDKRSETQPNPGPSASLETAPATDATPEVDARPKVVANAEIKLRVLGMT